MGGVAGGLGALGVLDDVLNGPRVKAEFVGQLAEQSVIRVAQIHPHQRAVVVDVFSEFVERKVLALQHTLDPLPGTDSRAVRAGGVGGHCGATDVT